MNSELETRMNLTCSLHLVQILLHNEVIAVFDMQNQGATAVLYTWKLGGVSPEERPVTGVTESVRALVLRPL